MPQCARKVARDIDHLLMIGGEASPCRIDHLRQVRLGLLATDGSEQVELIGPVKVLKRGSRC
jgi:hypothetical protein